MQEKKEILRHKFAFRQMPFIDEKGAEHMSLSKQMEAYYMEEADRRIEGIRQEADHRVQEADRKVQEADRRIALLENQLKILQDIVGQQFPQSPSTP